MIAVISFISLHLLENGAGSTSKIVSTFALVGKIDAADFLSFGDAPTDGLLQSEGDDRGDHCGVEDGDESDDQLNDELLPVATSQQTGAFTEEADEDGAGETTNAMHADNVEGVIVAELELETAGQAGQDTSDGTHHDGPQRGNHIGGGGDGDPGRRPYPRRHPWRCSDRSESSR